MYSSNKITSEEIEKIVNDLGYELLDDYLDKKYRKRIVIEDKYGYKYSMFLYNIEDGEFYIVGKLNYYSLENIKLWLKLNDKDFELCEDNVYISATQKLKFYHPLCNEFFYMSWSSVSEDHSCPFCAGTQVGQHNSLAYLRPDLVNEFLYSQHDKTPYEITEFSDEKVYWQCQICLYKWWATVSNRSSGSNCPACAGKVVTDKNRLSLLFPNITKEFHPTKNGNLTSNDVSYGSKIKVWWLCGECGHEWFASITGRINGNRSCPKCKTKQESKIAMLCKQYFYDNYNAIPEYKLFKNLENNHWLYCDIYMPDNIFIEIHGIQHYELNGWHRLLAKRKNISSIEEFEYRQYLDRIKKEFCQKNGLYIEVDLREIKTPIDAIEYIENILKEFYND